MALVREVIEVFFVVCIRIAENVARGKAAAERGPRNPDAAENETDVRVFRRLRDDGQQIAGRIDQPGPELDERQLSGVRKPALRPEELPPMMFFSISTTLKPLCRNSAAALTPLKPPPTINTSHLIDFVSGGQYL